MKHKGYLYGLDGWFVSPEKAIKTEVRIVRHARYVTRNGWSGIVVEPVPYAFERLRENYRNYDKVICEKLAISNREETRNF